MHALRVGLAEVVEPVVVGPGKRRRQRRVHVVHGQQEETPGREQHGHIYAGLLQAHKLRLGAPALVAVPFESGVGVRNPGPIHMIGHSPGAPVGETQQGPALVGSRSVGGHVPEPGLRVALEQVQRLADMHVAVQGLVPKSAHLDPPGAIYIVDVLASERDDMPGTRWFNQISSY